jgi:hypothetical protein
MDSLYRNVSHVTLFFFVLLVNISLTIHLFVSAALITKMLAEDLGLQTIRSIADTNALHCSTASHECSSGVEQKIHRFEGLENLNSSTEFPEVHYFVSNLLICLMIQLLSILHFTK